MQIKISKPYASPRTTADAGSIIDVSDEEGTAIINAGDGVEVDEKGKLVKRTIRDPNDPNRDELNRDPNDPTWQGEENASLSPAENAARRTGRVAGQRVGSGPQPANSPGVSTSPGTTTVPGRSTQTGASHQGGTGPGPGSGHQAGSSAGQGSTGSPSPTVSQGPAGRNR